MVNTNPQQPEPPGKPLFSSVWQLLDAVVLLPVQMMGDIEAPAVMPSEVGPVVPLWVDQERANEMLAPGFILRVASMADVLTRTRPTNGIVVEPGALNAVYIPAEQRESLLPMLVPFPPGARAVWGVLPAEAGALVADLTARASGISGLRRLWMARYQIEDARETVAVVYDYSNEAPGTDERIVAALYEGIEAVCPVYPVQVVRLEDVPDPTILWLTDSVAPVWFAAGEGDEQRRVRRPRMLGGGGRRQGRTRGL